MDWKELETQPGLTTPRPSLSALSTTVSSQSLASWPQLPGKKKNRTPEVRLLRVGGIGKEVLPPSCTPSLRPTASPGPEKVASKDAQPEITAPLRSVFLTTLVGDNKANKNLSLAAPQCTAHTSAQDRPGQAFSSSGPPSAEALYIHNYGHPGRRDSPAKKEEDRSLN